MEKVYFPMKSKRVSCHWNEGLHRKSSGGRPCDYPTDFVGKDRGTDMMYAPCDMKVLRVYGKASHGIWLRSVNPVDMPYGKGYYLYMMVEHESVKGFKRGQVYKQGSALFREGKYGNATGNHLHVSCGVSKKTINIGGRYSGWKRNSRGAWVLYAPGIKTIKTSQVFYSEFVCDMVSSGTSYTVKTNGSNLNVREHPNGKSKVVGSIHNGTKIKVSKKENGWGYVPAAKGWVSVRYLRKV